MQIKWPLTVLGITIFWIALTIAFNLKASAWIFGSAMGATTFRDPIFILLEFFVGFVVRKWWQLLILAFVLAVAYTMWLASMVGHELPVTSYLGRMLSVAVVASAIVLVRGLVRRGN